MRHLTVIMGALIALLVVSPVAAQGPEPDLRSCTPRDFEQQSGIPVAAIYIDAGEGVAVGREGSSAPFVASLQGTLLWSPSAAGRRLALGPLAGLSYANPKVHGMLGGRVRYRVLPIRIHDQMDLGLGIDLFGDAIYETPSAALLGLGFSLDLPLDAVVPINGPRLFGRVLRDTERNDWRMEIGLGLRPWRKLATNPRPPEQPSAWRFAIGSVQGAIEAAVSQNGPAPDALPTGLCDYTQIKKAVAVLHTLSKDASSPGSSVTIDTIVERFAAAGLDSVVAQLKHPANSWRRQMALAMATPPPTFEAAAVAIVSRQVRAALIHRFKLGGSP